MENFAIKLTAFGLSALSAAPAFAQYLPTVTTAKPPVVNQAPIPPGVKVQMGSGPYIYLDGQGDIEAQELVLRGGNVDVRSVDFAVGCPNGADQSGQLDSLCAISNALAWVLAHPIPNVGFASLYFPHGHYKIGTAPGVPALGTLLHVTAAVSFKGDGPGQSQIDNESPSSTTLQLDSANNCNGGAAAECPIVLQGLNFHQGGRNSVGNGIEALNTSIVFLVDSEITNSGGIALNIGGGSERWVARDSTISNSNIAVREAGDTNEMDFRRVNAISNGYDEGGYCYSSPACINHQLPVIGTGATWYPSPRPVIYLDGVKNHWSDSSIKGLVVDSGIRAPRELGLIENNYFEGYPWGGQPRPNSAVYAGGKLELGHTLAPMTTTSLSVPVDDAMFQPMEVNAPGDVQKEGSHAAADLFCYYPSDYLVGSTAPSGAVPGITRGTRECVQVWGFAGDGRMYVRNRGANPVAWPAGSIVEQLPLNYYGTTRIVANHFNTIDPIPVYSAGTYLDGCSDTALRANWVGNPSRACAEGFVGYVPDGYAIPYPSSAAQVGVTAVVSLEDNATYTGGTEVDGQGVWKVMANGNVSIVGDGHLNAVPNLDQVLSLYANGGNEIFFMNWAGTWAQGQITDPGAQVTSIPWWGYFDAVIPQFNQGPVHVSTGNICQLNLQHGATQSTERWCQNADGTTTTQDLVAGSWKTRAGTARTYAAQLVTPPQTFAGAPAGGHVESGFSPYCPVGQGAWTTSVQGFQPSYNSTWLTFSPPLPEGMTYGLSFNGYGNATGPQPAANIHVEICNTLSTPQTLPSYQQVFVNQIQQ